MSQSFVPFGDLSRVYSRYRGDIDRRQRDVLERGWFILGKELAEFEAAFAAYLGVRYVVGVGNGTDAIALALRAVGVGPGDEIITSPLTATFTALGVNQAGAVPVFADVDPETGNLDPDSAAAAVGPRTKAILPVHLYGRPVDLDAFRALADRHGLALVEDAAQAHGAKWRGRQVGSLGDAATFSFYPSKNLGAFGDAGAVATDSSEVAAHVRRLRDGGQEDRYRHVEMGVNSRLDELQAAVLNTRLPHLDADNARRAAIAARYDQALSAGRVRGVLAPADLRAPDSQSAHHLYVVRAHDRDGLAAHLAAYGVATAVHYPTPVHLQPAFGGVPGTCPHAETAADQVLSLPIFPELTDDEVSQVVAALACYQQAPTSDRGARPLAGPSGRGEP